MKNKKIILIDDEKELCLLLKEYFTGKGYLVCCAYDGQEGIKKVKTFEPDIIILDHRMPIMDGSDVIINVREFSSTPIICVSAFTNQATVDECLSLGANTYMFKPINLDELDQAVESFSNNNE